jgi:hypothetical protein
MSRTTLVTAGEQMGVEVEAVDAEDEGPGDDKRLAVLMRTGKPEDFLDQIKACRKIKTITVRNCQNIAK